MKLCIEILLSFAIVSLILVTSLAYTIKFSRLRIRRSLLILQSGTSSSLETITIQKCINRRIVETFSNPTSAIQVDNFRCYLRENECYINQVNLITLMHRCSKNNLNILGFISVAKIGDILDVQNSIASAQGIANALYSLHKMEFDSDTIALLLSRLTAQLAHSTEYFESQAVANMCYGLKNLNSDGIEAQLLLYQIEQTIKRCYRSNHNQLEHIFQSSLQMTAQGLGSTFLGLQGMSSEVQSMRNMLTILHPVLLNCKHSLDTQAFANIVLGLRSCTDASTEAKRILQALADILTQTPQTLKSIRTKELSMLLWGLQGMSSDSPEIDYFLGALTSSLEKLQSPLSFTSGDEVGPAIGGMRKMSSENNNVKRLLRIVTRALNKNRM